MHKKDTETVVASRQRCLRRSCIIQGVTWTIYINVIVCFLLAFCTDWWGVYVEQDRIGTSEIISLGLWTRTYSSWKIYAGQTLAWLGLSMWLLAMLALDRAHRPHRTTHTVVSVQYYRAVSILLTFAGLNMIATVDLFRQCIKTTFSQDFEYRWGFRLFVISAFLFFSPAVIVFTNSIVVIKTNNSLRERNRIRLQTRKSPVLYNIDEIGQINRGITYGLHKNVSASSAGSIVTLTPTINDTSIIFTHNYC